MKQNNPLAYLNKALKHSRSIDSSSKLATTYYYDIRLIIQAFVEQV